MAADDIRYFAPLAQARQISLTTFRKSGEGVATPVWFAERDGRLYLFTSALAGKVKRLRHTTRVALAPCTFNGAVTGPALEAQVRFVTDAGEARGAARAIRRKYWVLDPALTAYESVVRLFTRRPDTTIYLAIEPPPRP